MMAYKVLALRLPLLFLLPEFVTGQNCHWRSLLSGRRCIKALWHDADPFGLVIKSCSFCLIPSSREQARAQFDKRIAVESANSVEF